MSDTIVRCTGIGKRFTTVSESGKESNLTILDGIDFSLKKGDFTAIVGSSGCGKSTLLNIIGMLDRQSEGVLEIDVTTIGPESRNAEELCRMRNQKIGFVFQSHNLLPEMTAVQNIMIPLLIRGDGKKSAQARAEELMAELFTKEEMDSGVCKRPPAKLSGGQCQRVSVARALSCRPALILADEPTGNLDEKSSARVFDMLREVQLRHSLSIIMVTHDQSLVRKVDRAVHLAGGRLTEV